MANYEKGLAAQTTNPERKSTKLNFNDNSAQNQRLKLLDYLLEHNSITTKEAQEKLGIYYSPARKYELKKAGYQFHLSWVVWYDEHGIKHRIGKYTLTQKEPVEAVDESKVAA